MRLLGITIPDNKQIHYGLTAVHGIGLARSAAILHNAGVDPIKKTKDVTEAEEKVIRAEVEKFTLEGDLRRQVSVNIKRLKDIHSYRGMRHKLGLPARGQSTKNNSRTVRGNVRRTMGSGRVKVSKT